MKYSEERRKAVLAKLCPPHNRTVREVAAEEGVSEATLYNWRKQARARGELYPDAGSDAQGWNARDKFAALIETAAMNESERSAYCRKRGLYPEQLAAWRRACEQANDWAEARTASQVKADRELQRRMRELERDLACKEKALAETAGARLKPACRVLGITGPAPTSAGQLTAVCAPMDGRRPCARCPLTR